MSFLIEPSVEISNRIDFAHLANARGLVDAVEVGTDMGVFARQFLERFRGHWLFCVDPYAQHPDFPHDRMADMMTAVQALTPFHGRFRFVRHRSPDCIPFVRSLINPDFVYVDGDHSEEGCYADLAAWWDVLPEHGMLCGHDHDEAHPGVTAAVERFARERDVVVRLTSEADFPPSFYVYRCEPPELIHKFFRDGAEPNPHAARGKG